LNFGVTRISTQDPSQQLILYWLMMMVADQIAKRFLILGVTAAAVVPRQRNDTTWSIGGGTLSHPFRKLLLVIVAVNLLRLFLSSNEEYSPASGLFSDSLGVVEVTGLSFLCLVTPYVLQTRLAGVINVGRPGQDLVLPLALVAILSFFGVVLSRTVHPNLWFLKKVAVAMTSLPVIRTLKTYNSVTTVGGRGHGRGFIISQIVMTVEYWHIILQLGCALGYALNRGNPEAEDQLIDTLMRAARSTAFTGDWTRILCHATFLNMMDELYHGGGYSRGGTGASDEDSETRGDGDSTGDGELALVTTPGVRNR
jgi:hypothetical protein